MEDEARIKRVSMKKEVLEFHAEFCKAFSHPKRLEILNLLILGELTAGEIAEKLSPAKTNVYQHLRLMRKMRILKIRREGTDVYYMLTSKKIARAFRLMQGILGQLLEGFLIPEKEALTILKGDSQ